MTNQNGKLDPRIVRTRSLLKSALTELIKEKNFDEITIQDIADRSTLNRVTFYLHYSNKYDLLYHLTQDLIQEELRTISLPGTDGETVSYEDSTAVIQKYFEFIQNNADLIRSLIGEDGVLAFILDLEKMIFNLNIQRFRDTLGKSGGLEPETEMNFRHLAAGMLGMIRWWLENDQPYTPREMAEKTMSINQYGYYPCLGISARQEENSALPR
jgi:AcrR family transcriptional regulator